MGRSFRIRLGNIKVRHAVICTLSALFFLLIFSHGPSPDDMSDVWIAKRHADPEDFGPTQRYDKLQKLQDAQIQNKKEYRRSRRKLNKDLQYSVNNNNNIANRMDNPEPISWDDDLSLKQKELSIHERLKNLTNINRMKAKSKNSSANNQNNDSYNQDKPEVKNNKFHPPEFFNEMKAKVDNFLTKKSNQGTQRLPVSDHTKHKPKLDLNDPNKSLNLRYINENIKDMVYYKKEVPLIWVTGHPRSGTTLMRAMLDAHPGIRCGEETHIIPKILASHGGMVRNKIQMGRLNEANIDDSVISNAVGAYILTVIAQHGEPAKRLCNKDPMTILNAAMIKHIFPNSKFIFMIRDGRAVVHSIISRNVGVGGFDKSSYKGGLRSWNMVMTRMYYACQELGPTICLPVYYEQLVLHPQAEMEKILKFLGIEWNDLVLKHHTTVGKKGGVSLSKKEFSTDQVEKPVNLLSLTSWAKAFPQDARNATREVAPLLEILGYDPDMIPPIYGEPDQEVLENTKQVELKKKQKQNTN